MGGKYIIKMSILFSSELMCLEIRLLICRLQSGDLKTSLKSEEKRKMAKSEKRKRN